MLSKWNQTASARGFHRPSHGAGAKSPASDICATNTLEAWQMGLPDYISVPRGTRIPTIVAVGGGKGGVGKSIVSANLAAKLGEKNLSVLLMDLDLGSANLHTYFGMNVRSHTLAEFLVNNSLPFDSLFRKTSISNVVLVPGGGHEGTSDLTQVDVSGLERLWQYLLTCNSRYNFDIVILDLGAGTHRHTIDFFSAAHMGVVTVLPEPTSIENAYSFLKALMWRFVENVALRSDHGAYLDYIRRTIFAAESGRMSKSYTARVRQLSSTHPDFIEALARAFKGRHIGFVVNQIRTHKDIEVGSSMESICHSYFGYQTHALGYLGYDEAAWKSLRNRRLLVQDFPYSPIAKRLNEISNQLLLALGIT